MFDGDLQSSGLVRIRQRLVQIVPHHPLSDLRTLRSAERGPPPWSAFSGPVRSRRTNNHRSPTSSRRIYPSSRPYGGQVMSATCHYWFSWISQGQKRLTMGPSLSAAQPCASLTGGGAVLCVQEYDEFEPFTVQISTFHVRYCTPSSFKLCRR